MTTPLQHLPLGKKTTYATQYDPSLLCAIPRTLGRSSIGITHDLPFHGIDIWNAYEVSWLDKVSQKPHIGMAEFYIPCHSPYLIESKSLKLYLNSLNQSTFAHPDALMDVLQNDLSKAAGETVTVKLLLPPFADVTLPSTTGIYLDQLAVDITDFLPNPQLLTLDTHHTGIVQESVYSHLLKTNCPVTQQPDWATLFIRYEGKKIDHAGLLAYIISFREHTGFHEQCVEQIFVDILRHCQPTHLAVYARYTRRGGLDINPFRSNRADEIAPNRRICRQ